MKRITALSLAVVASIACLLSTPAFAGTQNLRGINWADPSGNGESSTPVEPSGLTISMTASAAASKATAIATAVLASKGTTVRMPITYGTTSSSTYWPKYQAAINALVSKGCTVILCWWSPSGGTVNNQTQWYAMWDKVNAVYKNNSKVKYEPINEPYGYSSANLRTLYAAFLARYGNASQKYILDGTGYATGVTAIGSDSRFNNQLIGFHSYHWFWTSVTDVGNWYAYYTVNASAVGSYASRTVITEMGVQTVGRNVDFWWHWEQGTPQDVSFLTGTCAYVYDNAMGSIQWSGVNDVDSYRWFWSSSNLTETRSDVQGMFRWSWHQ
jgi:hypothetical protein